MNIHTEMNTTIRNKHMKALEAAFRNRVKRERADIFISETVASMDPDTAATTHCNLTVVFYNVLILISVYVLLHHT